MPRPENMTKAQLDNLEKGKFRKGVSGNPNGRPKDSVKELLRKCKKLSPADRKMLGGLNQDEVNTCERIPMSLSVEGVRAVMGIPGIPLYLKAKCKEALADLDAGETRGVSRLRTLQYGEPQKNLDVTTAGQPLNKPAAEMTDEEIKDEIRFIVKAIGL